jgi:hypothetical protein
MEKKRGQLIVESPLLAKVNRLVFAAPGCPGILPRIDKELSECKPTI